ncbi:MAG: hypothetical protein J6Z30_08285 [Pyramidobacter sp.]|nr:hypothetical protein [Pyramidobacter sp.]
MAEQRKIYRSPEFKLFKAVQNRLSLYGLYNLLRFVPSLCEMSVVQLGSTLGISTKTLQGYLEELESNGLIERIRTGHKNTVVVCLDCPCDLASFIDSLCDSLSSSTATTPDDLSRAGEEKGYGNEWYEYLHRLNESGSLALLHVSLNDARRIVAAEEAPVWRLKREAGLICPLTGEPDEGDVFFVRDAPDTLKIYHVLPAKSLRL